MLGTLIRSQVLENVYGIKFVVTFIVCILLVLGTTLVGVNRYQSQQEEEQRITTINRGELEQATNWWSVGRTGVKLVKPVNRLGIFASGLEDSVGRTATVKDGDFPHMEDSLYSTAPIFAVFGDLDLTFIIKIVISLFAILFTYDLISGEKERGTLKLCLSNSVPRNTYMLGKSIGAFISLLIPLVIPLLIGILIMLMYGNVSLTGDEWVRLGIIVLGYVFYLLAFFSLGIFVSALTRHSAISFLMLLFIWVLFVLVVPKASMMIANQVHPIPGINEVRSEQFQLQRDYWMRTWEETRRRVEAEGGSTMDRSQRWALSRTIREEVRAELEPDYLRQNEQLVTGFKQQQANLTNLAMALSRVSPASAVTYIGMNMSGTGFAEQENFLGMLTDYRERFTDHVETEQRKLEEQGGGGGRHFSSSEVDLDINSIPRFSYSPLDTNQCAALVLPDLLMMAFVTIIFYTLGFVLFLRYDVR